MNTQHLFILNTRHNLHITNNLLKREKIHDNIQTKHNNNSDNTTSEDVFSASLVREDAIRYGSGRLANVLLGRHT